MGAKNEKGRRHLAAVEKDGDRHPHCFDRSLKKKNALPGEEPSGVIGQQTQIHTEPRAAVPGE